MTCLEHSVKHKAPVAEENLLLAIGLSDSQIALLNALAVEHQFRVVVADMSCDLRAFPAFVVVANPTRLSKNQFDLLLASEDEAAKVLFTKVPPWPVPTEVWDAVIVDRGLFRDMGMLTFCILVRKNPNGQSQVGEDARMKTYWLVRRYFTLDRTSLSFSVQRDELIQVEASDLDDAFHRAIKQIDQQEGMLGVIANQGRSDGNELYIGLHADRELERPQLPSMDRMHLDGDVFDVLLYPEGGKYHGEGHNYLHIEDRVFQAVSPTVSPTAQLWYFEMEDHYLDAAFGQACESTGRLMAFCCDQCMVDGEENTRECWLYRTDDGHYLLHMEIGSDDRRIIYRSASGRAITRRAENALSDGSTAQSRTFLKDAALVMGLRRSEKREA